MSGVELTIASFVLQGNFNSLGPNDAYMRQ